MEKVNIWDIEGTEFPAGRRTRVILGQNGAMEGSKFCQGYVVVYKGGGIPEHDHETVESYTIIKGHGEMEVDGEKQPVKEGDCIFIPGNLKHALYAYDVCVCSKYHSGPLGQGAERGDKISR